MRLIDLGEVGTGSGGIWAFGKILSLKFLLRMNIRIVEHFGIVSFVDDTDVYESSPFLFTLLLSLTSPSSV